MGTINKQGAVRFRSIAWRAGFFLALTFVFPAAARSQYYDTGQTPARQRWLQVKSDSLRMIFPREFETGARKTMFYMDAARPYVNYGLTHGPLRTPVIFKTENFYSNGLAMLAPRRIELVAVPSGDTYAEPWLKQLAVHEYRHMVQYGNINRNTVKVLGYIFGQQLPLVATGLLPFWFIEGDAVMAETQMADFGRGMQPSFSMHYRALGREILEDRNPDKWFAGSYRDYVPSHYELGYQLIAWSQEKYGKYIWDDIVSYTSKYPFFIFTTQLGLGKYYDTSTKKLFRETFSRLNDYWDSLPDTEDSARPVVERPASYTTYSHPLFVDDNTIIALRSDLHKTSRFVKIDVPTGSETHLAYTGPVSSRPEYGDGRLWWTEYRQSPLWDQKTDSKIYYMDITTGRTERCGSHAQALYPTVTENGLAFVRYHYDGHYSIERGKTHIHFKDDISIHGLAFDNKTESLYFVALSDEGMWIGGIGKYKAFYVTSPAKITLSDLRAGEGRLYFGSIAEGKDEAHMIDLRTGTEYRLTDSRYGAFSPAPQPGGEKVAVTVYDRNGYRPAIQHTDGATEVATGYLPMNTVSPLLTRWEVADIGSVVFTEEDLARSKEERPARRYGQLSHMFNVHSWAPIYFEPENIINGTDFNVHAGATLVSQGLLGNAASSLGYGYTTEGNSLVRGKISYLGSIPKFELSATWSNEAQRVSKPENVAAPENLKDYLQVSANAYVPVLLSAGHHIRRFTASVQYLHRNTLVWDSQQRKYIDGENYLGGALLYTENVRQAQLDLQPRWGYALKFSLMSNPLSDRFMTTWSVYGRTYLPGVARHHGLSLAASYMRAEGEGIFGYPIFDVLPRGYKSDFLPLKYFGASANYRLPVAYPDWGISGVVFLKRIWMSVGIDYGRYPGTNQDSSLPLTKSGTNIWSWGGALNLDIVPFRLPSQGTCSFTISCFVPANTGKPFVSAGFSVPL